MPLDKPYRLMGCNPGPWHVVGEYKSDHSAICAMASHCDDHDWLKVMRQSDGRLIAEYRKGGL